MCGLAGTVDLRAATPQADLSQAALRMSGAVSHRGPDDEGVWTAPEVGLALSHRRLSIVDLSPDGHQPMISRDGRWVLAYNGEVYDYRRVRQLLQAEGVHFRSSSDTEVLLEAVARWGVRRALEECNGMWAFGVYDRQDRRLTLAVDRMGEKPLYVGWTDRWLYFGSELKALAAHPAADLRVDRDSLAAYLRYGCVPAPYSIYESVHKLPGGSLLDLPLDGRPPQFAPQQWWSTAAAAEDGLARQGSLTADAALDDLDDLLTDSVRLRMVADVPVGAFLSGGVDSSLVTALMAEQSTSVRTFSIGFTEAAYDEAPFAAAVARHLGTDHTELYVTPEECRQVIPRLPDIYDEPFADSSQIPTALLAALTRQHVTVALSGDAGDELFSGYVRYGVQRRLARGLGGVPMFARHAAARALVAVPPRRWDGIAGAVAKVAPPLRKHTRVGDRLHKAAGLLDAPDARSAYVGLMSSWADPGQIVMGGRERLTALTDPSQWPAQGQLVEQLRLIDQLVYLPDDILTKVDRAAMAASLETRIPLLDPRVIRLAWAVPQSVHEHDGKGKYLLRALLAKRVPVGLTDRPKRGFGVPIGAWLRGPLRPWAEELLGEGRLRREGFLTPGPVRQAWAEHLAGSRDWTARLWAVLMWQAWHERWVEPPTWT